MKNKQSETVDVTVLVSTETKDIREQPIRVRSWVSDVDFTFPSKVKVRQTHSCISSLLESKQQLTDIMFLMQIFAEVKKGYNAIIDASVISTVGRPQGEPWIMMLFDNGAGKSMENQQNPKGLRHLKLGFSTPTHLHCIVVVVWTLVSSTRSQHDHY